MTGKNHIVFYMLFVFSFAFGSCETMDRINRFEAKGYSFVINDTDTLTFDKIYLDGAYNHAFEINKKLRTISCYLGRDSQSQLLDYKQVEHLYENDSKPIAFIIFQGDLISPKDSFYIQRSLLENPLRLKAEDMGNIEFNIPEGDILIFK